MIIIYRRLIDVLRYFIICIVNNNKKKTRIVFVRGAITLRHYMKTNGLLYYVIKKTRYVGLQ